LLLEAWSHLRPQNWKLVIAGNDDGGHAAEVVQQIKQLNLEEVAQVVGPLENEAKEAAFLNADAFVLPTYSENFGIVVAEAMSYGLPVLTTTGAPWRMLRDEDCGWWVEPATPEIEKALLQLFACERTRRITMGLKARELVQTHFAWPSIGERMRAFYEHLLFKTSKPDFLYP
ncbi:MAG: glycosyltransferase, partial [Puniceicoccales bacterium]